MNDHAEPGATMKTRIYRNATAHFYDQGDTRDLDAHYPDAWFMNLRAHGFNAFWLSAWLRDLVAFRGKETAEQARRLDELSRLIDRAHRFGVGLYLFLNEPRAFPVDDPFWEAHADMAGPQEPWYLPEPMRVTLICTSTRDGKDYVYEGSRRLHRRLPELTGTIHINASEYPTHCACHVITNPGGMVFATETEHEGIACPRCAERAPEEVVAEILGLFRQGARDAGSDAAIIAWNWCWVMYAPDPQPALIDRLHPEIAVMATFECGGHKPILGRERRVDEYSLIYVGPSDQYRAVTTYGQERGHEVVAKLQLGTTHEAPTTANMPLVGHLFDKIKWLRDNGHAGFLGTWNFGSRFTLNTAAVALAVDRPELGDRRAFLHALCRIYLGRDDTEGFCHAVETMEAAFDAYPLANRMLYVGPMPFALGHPLDGAPVEGKPLSQSWLDHERGDDWDACRGPYTWDEILEGYAGLVEGLTEGVQRLQSVLLPSRCPWDTELGRYGGPPAILGHGDRLSDEEKVRHARAVLPEALFAELPELEGIHGLRCLEEWSNAWTLLCMCESTLNLFRNHVAKTRQPDDAARVLRALQERELEIVERALPLFCLDERLGLHLEHQIYLVSREKLEDKRDALRRSLSA